MQPWPELRSSVSCRPNHAMNCCLTRAFAHKGARQFVLQGKTIGILLSRRTHVHARKSSGSLKDTCRLIMKGTPGLRTDLGAGVTRAAAIGSDQADLVSTMELAPMQTLHRELNFTDQHVFLFGFIACATTGALSCLLLAAIPTLIAFKKAAESLGRLADAAREELPGTMAAVRLSGMEISDLTMELSDLGQEISEGVRSSARAVRAAEDGLRRMGSFTSVAMLQERASGQVEVVMPAVARAARSTREALVRARSLLRSLITLTRFSSWLGSRWHIIQPWKTQARRG